MSPAPTRLADVLDSARLAFDTAASDGLLAVVGADSSVCDELVRVLSWRTVAALDDDDLAAIVSGSRQVLDAKAVPSGAWRDWRAGHDATMTLSDVVRGTLELGIAATLREHLRGRAAAFIPAKSAAA